MNTLRFPFQAGAVTSFAFPEGMVLVHPQQRWHNPVPQQGSKLWSVFPNPQISHIPPHSKHKMLPHKALARAAGPAQTTTLPLL